MRRLRRFGSLGGSGQGSRSGFGSSESYILDPLLLPRLQQYSHNNQLSNIEAAVEYLRRNYREYRRKQQSPFRKLVVKAVHILKKRGRCSSADEEPSEEQRFEGSARAIYDSDEILLQERESKYMMRLEESRRSDELHQAESFDNSSENSDGVESEGMSEGGGEEVWGETQKQRSVKRITAAGKGKMREGLGKGKDQQLATGSKRVGASRREGRDKETSDSEEELAFDEMEDEKQPSHNLLNSSLRATYNNGRPSLVTEGSNLGEKSAFASSSSSLFKFSSLPKVGQDDREKFHGESSKAGGMVSTTVAEDQARPSFALPSVVAEASRVALLGKRSRKGPVIDQETREAYGKGSASGANAERDHCRGSPPAQSSGRHLQVHKLPWQNPAHYAPDNVSRLQKMGKVANVVRSQDEARSLERVESGVGTYESSGQIVVENRERENGKVRSSRRCKSENGRLEIPADGVERASSSSFATPQNVYFKDIGGIGDTLEVIRENIEYPLAHPELYEHLGVQPPRGVLLHGPPGCGKTMLANAIAVETGVPFLKISAPEVVSGMSGESEAKVRALFTEAVRLAPCIIFIDEIDAITPKRETAQREMERRIVAQLLTCMDDLNQTLFEKGANSSASTKKRFRHVVVIGATNRPDALDPALRRAGRFDREIVLGIPDEKARACILSVLAQKLRLEGSFDFNQIAKRTPGFVGADLAALTKEAAAVAVKRIFISRDPRQSLTNDARNTVKTASLPVEGSKSFEVADIHLEDMSTLGVLKGTGSPESISVCKEVDTDDGDQEGWRRPWTHSEMESLSITMQDFEEAIAKVQPSAKREGFAIIPDVTWDDVGSLGPIREELEFSISRPIKHPEDFQAMGLDMATGVLLFGPPGCGKTLVAKAISNDAGANFISVKGPELLNKYFGESERAVRQLFTRARASAPCVLFFDEMDAMAPRRGNDGNAAAERVVNQLLTEMDGLESRKSIFIIAATNRPDMIDPALMRPGRFDKLLYVPLPDSQGRVSILRTLVRKVPLAKDVDITSIAESVHCEGFSGADLASLVREACIASMRERMVKSIHSTNEPKQASALQDVPLVSFHHFTAAFTRVFPSVSSKDQTQYEVLRKKLRCAHGSLKILEEGTDDAVP